MCLIEVIEYLEVLPGFVGVPGHVKTGLKTALETALEPPLETALEPPLETALETTLEEDMLSVEVIIKEKLWLIATENNQPMLIKFFLKMN